jgi:hypothetical protein
LNPDRLRAFIYETFFLTMNNLIDESPRSPGRDLQIQDGGGTAPHTPDNQYVFDNGQFRSVITGELYQPHYNGRLFSPGQAEGIAALSTLRASPSPPTLQSLTPVITAAQLQELITQLTHTIKRNNAETTATEEHLFSIAKSEHYISQGLTYKFDGDHEKLAPWIKKFKALRTNALWRDATYLTVNDVRYDILADFTKIKESSIKAQAKDRWTTDNQAKSLKPNHPAYFYPRILGKVVIGSITDDFYTILQNYAGDDLASDGPFLLWLILTHFHASTITYQEKLKHQIRSRTLAGDHKDDIESYLVWLHHTIDVLNTTTQVNGHTDLITPIFNQLLTAKSTRFRRIIEDWHLEYHSEEKDFTPSSLVEAAEKKCKALRQSNQLYTATDSEIFVMEATMKYQATPHQGNQTGGRGRQGSTQRHQKPAWYNSPPSDHKQTYRFDDRLWHWCPKCGDTGKWVCTHTPDKHQDNFTKKRKASSVTPEQAAQAPHTVLAQNATPVPVPIQGMTPADIAKLIAEQVATQLQAHLAVVRPQPSPKPTEDESDKHILATD